MCLCDSDDLISRLDDIEAVTLDEERAEVASLIDSGDFADAESLIAELEVERT